MFEPYWWGAVHICTVQNVSKSTRVYDCKEVKSLKIVSALVAAIVLTGLCHGQVEWLGCNRAPSEGCINHCQHGSMIR